MERTFKVIAENGIHARPATNLVNLAMRFESDIWLVANNKKRRHEVYYGRYVIRDL